jgi:hypothetical protein
VSYGFTVYTDRASIETTKVYSQTASKTYEYDYGTGQHSLSGFTDGDYLNFTAVPAYGYEFKRWVYHIGSPSAATKYSTSNPFKYYGSAGNDIYIAAEGQTSGGGSGGGDDGEDDSWSVVNKGSLGTITTQQDISLTIASYEVYRYAVQFAYEGTAIFYTTGSVNTFGQYSDNTTFDSSKGSADYIKQDNDGGDGNNFYITSKTVSAGTTYYVWVSGSSGGDTGTTTLHIIPPAKPATETVKKWSWSASNGSASATQTSSAYNAVANKKATTNFSHLVWNDMVDKVNEVIKAYSSGKSWDSTYATYSNTKMSTTPYYLTAVKFNSLRNNIEIVGNYLSLGYKTDIGKVEPGNHVKGEYLLALVDYINNCIDNL